jgi:hypothetical protein
MTVVAAGERTKIGTCGRWQAFWSLHALLNRGPVAMLCCAWGRVYTGWPDVSWFEVACYLC